MEPQQSDASSATEGSRRSPLSFLSDEVPAKRPNKRGQQTRDKLVRAATECFSEYGYTCTRVSDIADRAGTAQGNFYRHFSSLDAVFIAALRPALEDLAGSSGRSGGAADELTALVDVNITYLRSYARNRHILRVMREAAAASPNEGFRDLWLKLRNDFVDRTRRWLLHRHEQGQIAETNFDMLAETLGCMTEQMAYIHIGLSNTTPRLERLRELGNAIGEVWYRSLPRAHNTPDTESSMKQDTTDS